MTSIPDTVTTAVNNTSGVITYIRHGRGAAGVLLEDPVTANNVKQIAVNSPQATGNLNTATVHVNDLGKSTWRRRLTDPALTAPQAGASASQPTRKRTSAPCVVSRALDYYQKKKRNGRDD